MKTNIISVPLWLYTAGPDTAPGNHGDLSATAVRGCQSHFSWKPNPTALVLIPHAGLIKTKVWLTSEAYHLPPFILLPGRHLSRGPFHLPFPRKCCLSSDNQPQHLSLWVLPVLPLVPVAMFSWVLPEHSNLLWVVCLQAELPRGRRPLGWCLKLNFGFCLVGNLCWRPAWKRWLQPVIFSLSWSWTTLS